MVARVDLMLVVLYSLVNDLFSEVFDSIQWCFIVAFLASTFTFTVA